MLKQPVYSLLWSGVRGQGSNSRISMLCSVCTVFYKNINFFLFFFHRFFNLVHCSDRQLPKFSVNRSIFFSSQTDNLCLINKLMGRLNNKNKNKKPSVLTHVELKVTFSPQRSNFTPSHHDHSAETKIINELKKKLG